MTPKKAKEMIDAHFERMYKVPERRIVSKLNSRNQSPARAFYRVQIVPVFHQLLLDNGHKFNEDDVHEVLKLKCNPIVEVRDDVREVVAGSTSSFDEQDHWNYNARCASYIETLTGHKIKI